MDAADAPLSQLPPDAAPLAAAAVPALAAAPAADSPSADPALLPPAADAAAAPAAAQSAAATPKTPLQREWALWEHRTNWKGGKVDFNDLDIKLYSFDTVEDFWEGYTCAPTLECVCLATGRPLPPPPPSFPRSSRALAPLHPLTHPPPPHTPAPTAGQGGL